MTNITQDIRSIDRSSPRAESNVQNEWRTESSAQNELDGVEECIQLLPHPIPICFTEYPSTFAELPASYYMKHTAKYTAPRNSYDY